ncbi:YceI family protein [Agaribacterium haliotis]|uniref:YceI family protein n=1 Tax=Agaribacterium haliotis TaxID=2013869 RepID=UPI000BB5641B|nr:YceI family protein [Agaribacterium haliotis]
MKSVRLISGLIFTVVLSTAVQALPAKGTYDIDAAHSYAGFKVDHLGYSKLVGRFNDISGEIIVKDAKQGSLVVLIKSASIDTNHQKRDEHLRSPDFFNSKQFPELRFTSPLQVSKDGKSLSGELTLLGVKKNISLALVEGKQAKDPWGLERIGYSATTTIKRSDFGMDYMLGGIGDEIEIEIFVEAVKK